MKKGLVLEGGGLRGMFTVGVLDVFLEHEVKFDGMIGVSAGACFGCNFKSKQHQRALRYNIRFAHDKRYSGFYSWMTTGNYFNANFAYHTVADKLDVFDKKVFNENPMEFHLVVTDVLTGAPIYKKIESCDSTFYEWLRASASMPVVSRPVEVDGMKLLDGGISDSIPLQFFENLGFNHNVVVLTQPMGYRKKKMTIMPFLSFSLRKYPCLVHALKVRHEMYNRELDYLSERQKDGTCMVICPEETLPIGRLSHDTNKMEMTYLLGRRAAEKFLISHSLK